MSYLTGTATDVDDLLGKLSAFAQLNGWTENKVVAGSGNGSSSEVYLSKGQTFVIFDAQLTTGNNLYHGVQQALDHPHLDVYVATGFNGANPAANQPGTSLHKETNWLLPNMTAFHFFTDSTKEYLHVVVEVIANEFRHIQIGLLEKIGAYDGGQYNQSTNPIQSVSVIDVPNDFQHSYPWTKIGSVAGRPQFIRVNIDGVDWKTSSLQDSTSGWAPPLRMAAQGEWLDNHFDMKFFDQGDTQPNKFNTTAILFPMPCFIYRSSTQRAPVGKPFDVRMVNVQNITPSSSIFFGGDEWVILPFVQKKDPRQRDELPNSGWLAFAYLKVP